MFKVFCFTAEKFKLLSIYQVHHIENVIVTRVVPLNWMSSFSKVDNSSFTMYFYEQKHNQLMKNIDGDLDYPLRSSMVIQKCWCD